MGLIWYNVVMPKKIPDYFKHHGIERELVTRNENVCIYKCKTFESYDVMYINRVTEDRVITFSNGCSIYMYEGDEYLPSDGEWGRRGWTFIKLENAYNKFNELTEKIKIETKNLQTEEEKSIETNDN